MAGAAILALVGGCVAGLPADRPRPQSPPGEAGPGADAGIDGAGDDASGAAPADVGAEAGGGAAEVGAADARAADGGSPDGSVAGPGPDAGLDAAVTTPDAGADSGGAPAVDTATDLGSPEVAVAAPPAPAGLQALAGDGQVSLTWGLVAGASGYNLYHSTSPGVSKLTGTRLGRRDRAPTCTGR
jgi:hypothetical protein